MRASGLSSKGQPVWALHGLGITLARFARDAKPTRIVTAFDLPGGSPARRAMAPGYKGNRHTPEEDLRLQLNSAIELFGQAGLGSTTVDGWEADDVMASAVRASNDRGWQSIVVSSDRDAYQLIGERCVVAKPDGVRWDSARVMDEIGVTPDGYRHLAALRGEPSDNLTGIPGVGPKTAVKILNSYASVDHAVSDMPGLETLVGKATAAKLSENISTYHTNLRVGELRQDLPVDAALDIIPDADKAQAAFLHFGLPAAAAKLSAALRTAR